MKVGLVNQCASHYDYGGSFSIDYLTNVTWSYIYTYQPLCVTKLATTDKPFQWKDFRSRPFAG